MSPSSPLQNQTACSKSFDDGHCPDPEVLGRTAVARGVASAVLGNWQAWRGCLSDLFWIRPSWILCGVSNGRRPD